MGRLQMAAAAKLMRMDADAAGDATKLIEAARQNHQRLAQAASGIRGRLDVSV